MNKMEVLRLWIAPPPKILNPNNLPSTRFGAISRTKAKRMVRSAAEIACLSAMQQQGVLGRWESAVVEVIWYFPTARFLDEDNAKAMLKPVQDGFTNAQLWVDDNHVSVTKLVRSKDPRFPRVELVCFQTS